MALRPSWTCIAEISPFADGRAIVFAPSEDADAVEEAVRAAGYAVVSIDGTQVKSFRDAQALVATALSLPGSAATNLDALADGLRDLSRRPQRRVALLWHGAVALIERDLDGWYRLTEVLASATDDLWRGDDPGDTLFETVLFIDGFGSE